MRSASENSGLRQLFSNKKKETVALNNDVVDGDGGKQSEFTPQKSKHIKRVGEIF